MANKTLVQNIVTRNDTAANWATQTRILLKGEMALATDTGELRVGDGTKSWSQLSTFMPTNAQVTNKMDKVSGSVDGYFASLNADGQVVSSGKTSVDFDAAGAADSVLGKAADTSADNTVYGAKALANEKVADVAANNASIEVSEKDDVPGAKYIKVAISPDSGNGLSLKANGLFSSATEATAYSIVKATEVGEFAARYYLSDGGATPVGAYIDIPKDMVVESGTVKTVTEADKPVTGYVVGDKYIDLVLANAAGSHLYILVSDLVDEYTAGDGIKIDTISGTTYITAVIASGANGLSVQPDGISLALAASDTNGAMSSTDFTKLAGVEAGAQANKIESVQLNGVALPITNKSVNIASISTDLLTQGTDVLVFDGGTSAS